MKGGICMYGYPYGYNYGYSYGGSNNWGWIIIVVLIIFFVLFWGNNGYGSGCHSCRNCGCNN